MNEERVEADQFFQEGQNAFQQWFESYGTEAKPECKYPVGSSESQSWRKGFHSLERVVRGSVDGVRIKMFNHKPE